MTTISSIHLVLLIAAVWRLANLLANEDGPFHMFKTLRSRIARAEVRSRKRNGLLSKLHLYEGVNCEYCNSIWFGVIFTVIYLIFPIVALALALPLALSTGAIVTKTVVNMLHSVDVRFDQQNQAQVSREQAWENELKRTLPPSSFVLGSERVPQILDRKEINT